MSCIEISNLHFEYPGVLALDNVSFSIQPGTVTALVGPNGAGKTTLLRCIAALDSPISGSIYVDGTNVLENPRGCHRKIGYLSDLYGLYEELTVTQCLTYIGLAHGVTKDQIKDAIIRIAKKLDMEDRLDSKVRKLSRGLRQRIGIAQAIIHDPKVLLLDEPASGLDPEARHSLAKLLLNLQGQGITIIVSSHILSELEEYSTDMLILRKGKIISHEKISSILSNTVRIAVSFTEIEEDTYQVLNTIDGITGVKMEGHRAFFNYSEDIVEQRNLLKKILELGLPVHEFMLDKTDLQQSYLKTIKE